MTQYPKTSIAGPSTDSNKEEDAVSLVHHPHAHHLEEDELIAVIDLNDDENRSVAPPMSPKEKPGWEQLATPWGMGALLIFLLANTLLSWVQWSNYQQSLDTASVSNDSLPESSIPYNSNLARGQKENNLTLDRLSTVAPVSSPVKSNSPESNPLTSLNKTVSKASTAPKPVTNNLTNALLPPSLQPQFIPTTIPVTLTPSLSQSLTPVSPPIPSVTTSTQPVTVSPPPAPTQPVAISPPPAPTQPVAISPPPAPTPSQINTQLTQQQILEQIRVREQQPAPLGFNHKTRAELRSAGNQQDTSALVEQLQQLNQQRIDESNSTNSQQ